MTEPVDGNEGRYPIQAPGWRAIDVHLAARYGAQVPHQFASRTPYDLDSHSPLPAIGVYEGTNPSHWHYVSYGLTELFEKSSPNPDTSGFGFELTLRLLRTPAARGPAVWALRLLQGIAHTLLSGGFSGGLDTGELIDLGGPLRPAADGGSVLEGLVCVPDPELGVLATEHGRVLFLQLYGLARDELALVERWDLARKVGFVRAVSPRHVTDPDRGPFADDPRASAIVRRYALNLEV